MSVQRKVLSVMFSVCVSQRQYVNYLIQVPLTLCDQIPDRSLEPLGNSNQKSFPSSVKH